VLIIRFIGSHRNSLNATLTSVSPSPVRAVRPVAMTILSAKDRHQEKE